MIFRFKDIWTDYVKANQFASLYRFAISLLISVILVKSYLNHAEIGAFEYMFLFCYTLSYFWSFAYNSSILSRVSKFEDSDKKNQLSQIFLQLIWLGLFMAIIGVSFLLIVPSFFQFTFPTLLYWLLGAMIFFLISGILPENIYLLEQNAGKIVSFATGFYSLQLIIVLFLLFFKVSIYVLFLGYIGWQSLRFFWTVYLLKPKWQVDFKLQRFWFLYTLPLVGHFILGSGMDYLDGHLVAQFFDENQFLYYRYGARELPFSVLFLNALSAAFLPIISKNISALPDLKSRISNLMNWLFPLSCILMFLSPYLFTMVYDAEFIISAMIFNVYLLILSSRILMPQVLMYAHSDNVVLMWFSGIELLINLVLSILLMKVWGIAGIAFATVVAFLVNRLISIYFCWSKYGIRLTEYLNLKAYLVWMTLLSISFVVSYKWMF